jgi:hypothetical protein
MRRRRKKRARALFRHHSLFKKLIILSTLAITNWQLLQVINYLVLETCHAFDKL